MTHIKWKNISIVIPAKNEVTSLKRILPVLQEKFQGAQIIVINDGSTDGTEAYCSSLGVEVVTNNYSKGNGAAIKSGARKAKGDTVVFMDGDGQHKPDDIPKLIARLEQGFDMVVGARNNESQASFGRLAANKIYNRLATWMVGHKIPDLTSGFRAVRRKYFNKYLYMLPNGFSYPTTITMAFFRAGHAVAYEPIIAEKREGKSHIRITHDGIRFLLIIFKVGTLYSPLKLFLPVSALLFMAGFGNYVFSYAAHGTFTNMSTLMLLSSLIVFLVGLVAEQVTTLLYRESE
ncbi:glycosyltransferase family 2 protein [Exilibacterium tricleocarpae]|uniref:Glycosyltransferase family 2 protein n=1 Tax=Exilibacterium tricleocarpae TaxID=2591008 RepID=A0A545TQF4_9GAMM|nr:glycosyltransferase family 2 protein [Exilibacterium tricleocarpae]TQV79462.1 glycosyltransferase family 2 protein [Exilibacterium tricleocarpae]